MVFGILCCGCVLARQIGSCFSCFHDKVSMLFGGLYQPFSSIKLKRWEGMKANNNHKKIIIIQPKKIKK